MKDGVPIEPGVYYDMPEDEYRTHGHVAMQTGG